MTFQSQERVPIGQGWALIREDRTLLRARLGLVKVREGGTV